MCEGCQILRGPSAAGLLTLLTAEEGLRTDRGRPGRCGRRPEPLEVLIHKRPVETASQVQTSEAPTGTAERTTNRATSAARFRVLPLQQPTRDDLVDELPGPGATRSTWTARSSRMSRPVSCSRPSSAPRSRVRSRMLSAAPVIPNVPDTGSGRSHRRRACGRGAARRGPRVASSPTSVVGRTGSRGHTRSTRRRARRGPHLGQRVEDDQARPGYDSRSLSAANRSSSDCRGGDRSATADLHGVARYGLAAAGARPRVRGRRRRAARPRRAPRAIRN